MFGEYFRHLFRRDEQHSPRRGHTADAYSSRCRFELLEERLNLSTIPLSELPLLHSNPGASKKLFLDFDGHVTTGTAWNTSYFDGNPIHSPAFDRDGDIFSYIEYEIDEIVRAWKHVSEDFAPFDVDVTTEEPDISLFTAGGQAIRVIFSSKIDDERVGGTGEPWLIGPSGLAYIGSWAFTTDTPAWVWNGDGQTASHEIGHTFGLLHDGLENGTYHEYYGGHSVAGSTTYWSPIMGQGIGLAQWSPGDYTGATRSNQDDVAIIAAKINGFRADDHSNDPWTGNDATSLLDGSYSLSGSGVIEQRTDIDFFSFSATSGDTVTLQVSPYDVSPNLNIEVLLYDALGNQLAVYSPTDQLGVFAQLTLPSTGDYYVSIDGVGEGIAPDQGYTDYGSLGQYTITGAIRSVPTVLWSTRLPDISRRPDELESLQFLFSEDITASLDLSDLTVYDATGSIVDLTGVILDAATGTWDFSPISLVPGSYTAVLSSAGIIDANGNHLDGDSDGIAGGDFAIDFLIARRGDANLDGLVDGTDFDIYWPNSNLYLPYFISGWMHGDFNADSFVNNTDLGIWINNRMLIDNAIVTGDFTEDDLVDVNDIDFLYRGINIVADSGDAMPLYNLLLAPVYDLNGDGEIGQVDMDELILDVIGTVYGDANLDGEVSGSDLSVVLGNWGLEVDSWRDGDFDGDGLVAQADLDYVLLNWGYGTGAPQATEIAISGSSSTHAPYGFSTGDADRDNFVAGADLNTISSNWGRTVGIADQDAVLNNWGVDFTEWPAMLLMSGSGGGSSSFAFASPILFDGHKTSAAPSANMVRNSQRSSEYVGSSPMAITMAWETAPPTDEDPLAPASLRDLEETFASGEHRAWELAADEVFAELGA